MDDLLPQTMNRSRTDPERYLEFDEHSSREFLSIKNLDNYFMNIYHYHKHGGYWPIIYSKISNLITIAFTISFSVFLVGFIDWKTVINCGNDDSECKNVHLIKNNISSNKVFGVIVIMYTIVFAMYFIWHLLNFIVSLPSLAVTSQFYHDKLRICEQKLTQIEWSSVIDSIVRLQEKSIRLYHNKHLDALDITNRILRKENYMIAFINGGVLHFNPPQISFSRRRLQYQHIGIYDDDDDNIHNIGYLGAILEWNIRWIILESMFDDEMKIKDSFKNNGFNSSNLKWKLFWFGIGNLFLTPFTFVFRIIFFFLQNAEEVHRNKGDLLSFRQWTTIAKLKFREFNELPHDFESRMNLSIAASNKYISLFSVAPHVLVLSESISYISGSIVAVLLLLTFIDSSILLNIELCGQRLVWFLAIFSALLAIARSNIVYNDVSSRDYEEQMNEIASYTHYFPLQWQSQCDGAFVRDEFMNLFKPKINVFIAELLNVFTTPFVLMFTLPNSVDLLLKFITDYSDHIDGVGDICSYSRFDFKRFQNDFIKKEDNDSNDSSIDDISESTDCVQQTLTNKKLESSFLTFAINNPNWRGNKYQSAVLEGIKAIKKASASTEQLNATFSELLSCSDIHLFNNLQRYTYNDNDIMLSEINESDKQERDQLQDEEDNAKPYKTLAMEAINQNKL